MQRTGDLNIGHRNVQLLKQASMSESGKFLIRSYVRLSDELLFLHLLVGGPTGQVKIGATKNQGGALSCSCHWDRSWVGLGGDSKELAYQ